MDNHINEDKLFKLYNDYGDYKKQLKEIKANIAQLNKKGINMVFSMDLLNSIDLYLIPYLERGKIGFINKKAQVVIDPKYDDIRGAFNNEKNYVAVKIGNKWSAIDSKGNELLPYKYSLIFPSPDSSLVTCCKNEWSVIDLNTLRIIVEEGKYNLIEGFRYGYARVKNNNKYGIINAQGKIVLDTRYYAVYPWVEWYAPTTVLKEDENSKIIIKSLMDL